jgi:hypothetical protein
MFGWFGCLLLAPPAAITRSSAFATCRHGMCHHRHPLPGAKPRPARAAAESNPPPNSIRIAGKYPPRAAAPVRREHAIRVPRLLTTEWMNPMCVSTCQVAPCWDATATPRSSVRARPTIVEQEGTAGERPTVRRHC